MKRSRFFPEPGQPAPVPVPVPAAFHARMDRHALQSEGADNTQPWLRWSAGDTLADRVLRTHNAAMTENAVFSSFPPPPPEVEHRPGAKEAAVRAAFLHAIRKRGCELQPVVIDSCMRAVRRAYHGKTRQFRCDLAFILTTRGTGGDDTVLMHVEVDEKYHHPEVPNRLDYLAYDAGARTHIVLRLHTGPIPVTLGQKKRPGMFEEAYDEASDAYQLKETPEFQRRIDTLADAFMAYLDLINRGGCADIQPYSRIVKSIGWR